ncbi:MAG: hypothetical protein U0V87_15070 [Acidobacteriota bacterium]
MSRFRVCGGAWLTVAIASMPLAVSAAGSPQSTPPKEGQPEPKRVAVEFKRDPDAHAPTQDTTPRSAPELPDELKVQPRAVSAKTATPERSIPGTRQRDPEEFGASAGEKMALESARERGWRQYWRAGFHRGLREALDDSRSATWDRNEGLRYGRRDPAALALGGAIAQDAASDAAGRAASDAVRAEFTDLTREPRRSAARAPERGETSGWNPAGPWAIAPVYDDVFVSLPPSALTGLGRDARAALEGWNVQPATLARDTRLTTAYDGAWKDAAYIFSVWRDRQRPGSLWSRFDAAERERARVAFFESFDATMASLDLSPTYAGYRVGYADGWRYGVRVNAEWNYRQGYADGFDDGVRTAAIVAFPFLFERAFAAAYDAEFEHWSGNAMPALGTLHLSDSDDSGVIEPGEVVSLTGEVINYGGAPASVDVRADGSVLDGPATAIVSLERRSRTKLQPISLRVDQSTAARTKADIVVTVADDQVSVPIYVARPLEIDGDIAVDTEPLKGRVRLVVTVANRSRGPLRAETLISSLAGGSDAERSDFHTVPAEGTSQIEATYDALRPLDLIAGKLRWQAVVRNGNVENDTRTITIAPASTDLSNLDLVTYMIELARARQPARRDIAEGRALLLDRMRADWDRACADDGNPYRRDYDEASASTALGELVREISNERGSFASRAVFAGLGSDIATLADTLPGAHPLLRKWMKRLAKRVE